MKDACEKSDSTPTDVLPPHDDDQATERIDPTDAANAAGTADAIDATEKRPVAVAPDDGTPDGDAEAPRLRDVTGTFADYVRSRRKAMRDFLTEHRLASAILGILALAMVACLVMAFMHTQGVPDNATIESDARSRVSAPTYDPGSFGAKETLVTRSATVRSTRRSATAIDSSEAQFGASAYATADVLVSFSSPSVKADKAATLGYARVDGSWIGIGDETDTQVAWEALAGVDQDRVLENIDEVFDRAESSLASGSGSGAAREMSLAYLYHDADITVTSNEFDAEAQQDTLVINCEKASDFESYTCELTVVFSFSPVTGQWEISEASVTKDAKVRTFEPLVATWEGAFQSQSTDGTKCLAGGSEAGKLTVVVEKSETVGDTARLTGTISGVAHYHEHPKEDAESCEGDSTFEDIPFTATLVGGKSEVTGSDLNFVATLPEEVGGTVTVTLGFGVDGDPTRVVAVVQTTYPYTGSFLFIPFEETITYSDTYALSRAE